MVWKTVRSVALAVGLVVVCKVSAFGAEMATYTWFPLDCFAILFAGAVISWAAGKLFAQILYSWSVIFAWLIINPLDILWVNEVAKQDSDGINTGLLMLFVLVVWCCSVVWTTITLFAVRLARVEMR